MLRILQNESPNLFGDYAIVNLEGVGPAASTAFKKTCGNHPP